MQQIIDWNNFTEIFLENAFVKKVIMMIIKIIYVKDAKIFGYYCLNYFKIY